jgi:hypothetical protein
VDNDVVTAINRLADEAHQLERSHAAGGLSPEEQERLHAIEVQLDQCWDLLRQRRARRSAHENPDDATVRPPGVVEGYRQ